MMIMKPGSSVSRSMSASDAGVVTFFSHLGSASNISILDVAIPANRYMMIFRASEAGTVSKIYMKIAKAAVATGSFQVVIYLGDVSKEPTGAILSTTSILTNSIPSGTAFSQPEVELDITNFSVASGSDYCIIFRQGTSSQNITSGYTGVADPIEFKWTLDTEATWNADQTGFNPYLRVTS